ncbi:MAG: hypothetical protein AAF515_05095 [Pseudomonadota bacterium]
MDSVGGIRKPEGALIRRWAVQAQIDDGLLSMRAHRMGEYGPDDWSTYLTGVRLIQEHFKPGTELPQAVCALPVSLVQPFLDAVWAAGMRPSARALGPSCCESEQVTRIAREENLSDAPDPSALSLSADT